MIQIVYDKIINFCGIKEIPCVIVGSKIDLPQRYHPLLLHINGPACRLMPWTHNPHIRQVQSAEGEDLARANHAAWVETSAKNNINVGELPSMRKHRCWLASINVHGSQSLRAVSRRDRATNPDKGRTAS
jgi:GTPase SAR1 family protein